MIIDYCKELEKSKSKIKSEKDACNFAKNYCIENLILLNKEHRESLIKWTMEECGLK